MENCLITKLKSVVDNENLAKIDGLVIKSAQNNLSVRLGFFGTSHTIYIKKDGVETTQQGVVTRDVLACPEIILNIGDTIRLEDGKSDLGVYHCEGLTEIFDVNSLQYCTNLSYMATRGINFNIFKNNITRIDNVGIQYSSGSAENCAIALKGARHILGSNTTLIGSLSDFKGCTRLATLQIALTEKADAAVFVNAQRTTVGRTSGAVLLGNITISIDGTEYTGGYLRWTEDTIYHTDN